jgi:hypothetical protein
MPLEVHSIITQNLDVLDLVALEKTSQKCNDIAKNAWKALTTEKLDKQQRLEHSLAEKELLAKSHQENWSEKKLSRKKKDLHKRLDIKHRQQKKDLFIAAYFYDRAHENLEWKTALVDLKYGDLFIKNPALLARTITDLNIAAIAGNRFAKIDLIQLLIQDSLPVGTPFITKYKKDDSSQSWYNIKSWKEFVNKAQSSGQSLAQSLRLKTSACTLIQCTYDLFSANGHILAYDLLINALYNRAQYPIKESLLLIFSKALNQGMDIEFKLPSPAYGRSSEEMDVRHEKVEHFLRLIKSINKSIQIPNHVIVPTKKPVGCTIM